MTRDITRRLDTLERVERMGLGVRIFEQDDADPTAYFESGSGLPWSLAEIDSLASVGWRCVVIEYIDTTTEGL